MTNDERQAGARDPAFDAIAELVTRGLAGPLSAEDSAELDRLIETTPNGGCFAEELVDRWTLAGIAGDPRGTPATSDLDVPVTEEYAAVPETEERGHGWRRRIVGLVAAVVVLAVGGGLAVHMLRSQAVQPVLIAATDAPMTTTLQDGSRVSLSRDGKVLVRMEEHRRVLQQIGGEAYYEVAKDHTRPFTVETSGYRVTALGTRFNVSPDPTGTQIDLLEGRLRIETDRPGDQPVFLTAGQRFVGGAHPRIEAANPAAADWRSGRLVFNDMPLSEVAAKLSYYSGRRVGIRSPAAGKLRFSGVLRWDMPGDWSAAFEATLPVKVEQAPDGIEIVALAD
ncbi:FecR family protein [Novosphingobium sp. PhB165]|uniref:FecR family protein n=1 Tax=Novosphingobium sp. PhB165 TaxID=2485105 RepID=UPI0010439CB8|nr:FecR domain-containing protein [Novosphingobium sp. PhB165]TCM16569.1 FecR family protein [Novosphingobium sp. PhB165]